MPSVNGIQSTVDIAGLPTLLLTVSRAGGGQGYYVVHCLITDVELGDGMTNSFTSAKRDAVNFARYLVKLVWQEGAPDNLVRELAIGEFLDECSVVDWHTHPDEPDTEVFGVDHKGEHLFTGFVRKQPMSVGWEVYDEEAKDYPVVGCTRKMETAKSVVLDEIRRCLKAYADMWADDVLAEAREEVPAAA